MTTSKTIVRKAREISSRSLLDISSKVKAAALASVGTDLAAVGGYLAGTISVHALLGIAVASAVPVVAAYAKTSSEAVVEEADQVAAIAQEVGAVVTAVAPSAAPIVTAVEDGVATVQAMLDASVVTPAPAAEVAVPATTETLALSAPRPATAGGQ